jgi:hypothetical protein
VGLWPHRHGTDAMFVAGFTRRLEESGRGPGQLGSSSDGWAYNRPVGSASRDPDGPPLTLADRVKVVRRPAEVIGVETMTVHCMPNSPNERG